MRVPTRLFYPTLLCHPFNSNLLPASLGDPRPITDPIDLARLWARDPVLLAQLVNESGSRIWWAVRYYARDDDHADDLMQECWVVILERLDRYGGRGSFINWAIAVSKNVCRMHLRRAKRTTGRETALEDAAAVPDTAPDPQGELVQQGNREIVSHALERLPEVERYAIVLSVLEERTTAETAEALGMSHAGTLSLVKRALRRLGTMEEIQQLALDGAA